MTKLQFDEAALGAAHADMQAYVFEPTDELRWLRSFEEQYKAPTSPSSIRQTPRLVMRLQQRWTNGSTDEWRDIPVVDV